jgi:predicted nucleic acid-binding protein
MSKAIISDTSCLIALRNVDKLDVLKHLYGNVFVTKEVYLEFGEDLPDWIVVCEVRNKQKQAEIANFLDVGEAASIALALEFEHSLLIIDEMKGRRIAKEFGIEIIGTVGILLLADKKGLVQDVWGLILKIVNKGFRLSDQLLEKLIKEYRKR